MSTIALSAPAQPSMVNTPGVTSSLSAADNGTNDKKSFADCLKESDDHSDKDNQTAITPRPHTSPKRAAEEKEPRRKTNDEAPASPAIVAQPQVLDLRSLMLSWKNSSEATGKDRIASPDVSTNGVTASEQAAAAPVSKAPVAFTVSLPKDAAGAVSSANKDAQLADDGGAQGGHSHSRHPNDSSPAADVTASAPAPSRDAVTQTPAVPQSAMPTNLNPTAVHVAPAAYTHTDSAKASAPVANSAASAPIAEPPATPTLRPQSIDIRVPGTGDNQVDVRVSQRAGDVEVTVRTPNNELAQSLRQHLPELSDRLSESGVSGQIWQPAAAETSTGNGATHDGQPGSNWQGQQQNRQEQAQQEPDSQQNRRANEWLNEFYNAEQEGR